MALKEFKGLVVNPSHIMWAKVERLYNKIELLVVMTNDQKLRFDYSLDGISEANQDLRLLVTISGGAEPPR